MSDGVSRGHLQEQRGSCPSTPATIHQPSSTYEDGTEDSLALSLSDLDNCYRFDPVVLWMTQAPMPLPGGSPLTTDIIDPDSIDPDRMLMMMRRDRPPDPKGFSSRSNSGDLHFDYGSALSVEPRDFDVFETDSPVLAGGITLNSVLFDGSSLDNPAGLTPEHTAVVNNSSLTSVDMTSDNSAHQVASRKFQQYFRNLEKCYNPSRVMARLDLIPKKLPSNPDMKLAKPKTAVRRTFSTGALVNGLNPANRPGLVASAGKVSPSPLVASSENEAKDLPEFKGRTIMDHQDGVRPANKNSLKDIHEVKVIKFDEAGMVSQGSAGDPEEDTDTPRPASGRSVMRSPLPQDTPEELSSYSYAQLNRLILGMGALSKIRKKLNDARQRDLASSAIPEHSTLTEDVADLPVAQDRGEGAGSSGGPPFVTDPRFEERTVRKVMRLEHQTSEAIFEGSRSDGASNSQSMATRSAASTKMSLIQDAL